jgi:hypothetical protein
VALALHVQSFVLLRLGRCSLFANAPRALSPARIKEGTSPPLTHSNSGLAAPNGPSHQDRPPRNPTLLDHLEDQPSRLARLALTDHTLAAGERLEQVGETEASDVRMRADTFDFGQVLERRGRCD